MITVIADDITGAAEIAGVAWSHGVNAVISTDLIQAPNNTDVLVIATDTRSGNVTDAIGETLRLAKLLAPNNGIVFKKTDSALRGHVIAELETLIDAIGYSCALLLPQNPSKGRTIENGVYTINGKLLTETAFKDDPEFPATSSNIKELLSANIAMLPLPEKLPHNGKRIYVAEASDFNAVRRQIDKISPNTLLAGGADAFKALLMKTYPDALARKGYGKIQPCEYSIIVCGSTQSEDIMQRPFAKTARTYNATIPYNVFMGTSADDWIASLPSLYMAHKSLALTIGQKENGGAQCAIRLRRIMAEATRLLINTQQPGLLIIEGGATAYSILKELNWNNLTLKAEYIPGIVGMKYKNTEIIMKPGSYSWKNFL